MRFHDEIQEKADILILSAAERSKIDPRKDFFVISPDTDVLVNIRYYCRFRYSKTILITETKGKFRSIDIYEAFEAPG